MNLPNSWGKITKICRDNNVSIKEVLKLIEDYIENQNDNEEARNLRFRTL